MFEQLQTKIILVFVGLLAIVQIVSLVLVKQETHKNAIEQIEQQLVSGQEIFNQLIRYRGKQLVNGIRILASDFAFRDAAATQDKATILSALENHGRRVNADLSILISLDGKILADTQATNTESGSRPFPFPELLKQVKANHVAGASIRFGTHVYQFILVPVKAPNTIAWVGMGFTIDDQLALELKALTGLEISFVDKQLNGNRILASTLDSQLEYLLSFIDAHELSFNATSTIELGSEVYISYITKPKPGQRVNLSTILQHSFTQAIQPYNKLQSTLLTIYGIAFLAVIIGSSLLAKGITHPISRLAAAAKDMQDNGTSAPILIQQRDEIGQLAHAFNHMIKSIADREEQIIQQAYHDPLTGLSNRLYFNQQINTAIKSGGPRLVFTVMIISLERFDEINNTLGHNIGDKVIQRMSLQIQETCMDDIHAIARLSSNQFIIFHIDTHNDSLIIAKQIFEALEHGITYKDIVVDSDVHIGLSQYPSQAKDAKSLIQNADIAVHLAQQNGINIAYYDASHDERNTARLSMMHELRHAIETDELELFYQPKVNIEQGEITHVEALIRWHHPKHGFMPPDDFIPLAEQTGHIIHLTKWVLNTAIQQGCAFRQAGVDIKVAINLSTKDLMNRSFIKMTEELLTQHQAQADWFVLEVTESAVMQDDKKATEVLNELNTMGFDLSIDDYGTGYSSMSYLKLLPVQELKIDKSFILDLPNNQDDKAIVQTTIELGHRMGLTVIAEGVEDQATLDILQEMGCDMAQGYYVCRPANITTLQDWLRTSEWSPYHQS
ncbi:MAG: EAL domain-containing protein [Methylococcales bacterium]|jgi:diguanylate cyclase (GGDEF)-like protein|nr:EAL domain-containing protein [Methylococcales bacterium]MBT7445331.1 EAL domain-containing protein [Methylococcales bacterium]